MIEVFDSCEEGHASHSHRACYTVGDSFGTADVEDEVVEPEAVEPNELVDEGLLRPAL